MGATAITAISWNPAMTTCLICVIFLGTFGAQANIAADDLFEQCLSAVPESVCQPDATTKQQHIEIGAVTSGRGNGKLLLGKRAMLRWHGTSLTDRCTTQLHVLFSCSKLDKIKCRPSGYYIRVVKV